MTRRLLTLTTTLTLAAGITACGGDPIDQVRSDFESPSGSTADRDALIALEAQRSGGSPAADLASGGVPGLALMAEGHGAMASVAPRQWASRADVLFDAWAARKAGRTIAFDRKALGAIGCASAEEANAAFEEIYRELFVDAIFGFGDASGDATFTVDVDRCSEGALSGSLTVELKMVASDDEIRFEVKQTMDLCEAEGAQACVDGETVMRATGRDEGGSASTSELLAYWDVQASWQSADGAPLSGALRGGIRLLAQSTAMGGTGSVEYLYYLDAPDGTTYSFVYEIVASNVGGNGTVTWRIRGADGTLECTATETMDGGQVSCTGDAPTSWSEADAIAVRTAWFAG